MSGFLNQNEIANIVNEYKHRGLYIERGLEIDHYSSTWDSNNAYITKLDDEYSKDILEFDIDEKIQYLRDYNSKIVEFIKDKNTQDVLEHYKFDFFGIT